jgi:hypothetical protein
VKTNLIGFKVRRIIKFKFKFLKNQEAIAQDQVDSALIYRPNANSSTSSMGPIMPSRYQKKCSVPILGGGMATINHGGGSQQQQQGQRERRSTLSAALNQQGEVGNK